MDGNSDSPAGDGSSNNDSYAAKLAKEVEQLKGDKLALQQELASNSMLSSEDDVETVRECFKPHVPQAMLPH